MSNHLQVVDQKPAKQQQPGMIMPAGTIEQALEAFKQYQELKKKLGNSDDFQAIRTKDGGVKYHPKKSFVRKVQRFFNVSCEIIQDEPLRDEKGQIIAWLAKARAIHMGTGAYQEADGSCGFDEKVDKYGKPDKKRQTIHNIRAHAITRAKNRAILDLVGFGEVSAEEIVGDDYINVESAPMKTQQKSGTHKKLSPIGAKKLEILTIAKEKGLTTEQTKKLVEYQIQRPIEENNMTMEEADDLLRLVNQMSKEELLALIGEKAESEDDEELNRILQGGDLHDEDA